MKSAKNRSYAMGASAWCEHTLWPELVVVAERSVRLVLLVLSMDLIQVCVLGVVVGLAGLLQLLLQLWPMGIPHGFYRCGDRMKKRRVSSILFYEWIHSIPKKSKETKPLRVMSGLNVACVRSYFFFPEYFILFKHNLFYIHLFFQTKECQTIP